MVAHIYLLLGSNLGNRQQNLQQATNLILQEAGEVVGTSGVFETAAWGKINQSDFLNQVLQLNSHLSAEELLATILSIESRLGRIRMEKWGERIIDIDILYYADIIMTTDHLTLPHPGIPVRRFVLEPLCDLAPEFIHPQLKKSNLQLLAECSDALTVKKIS